MSETTELPYRLAVLCYLFDADGRVLLLHRRKPPNLDRYSPIGGKLEREVGESPTACAVREIEEEAGITVSVEDLHLTGMISESAFEDSGHWLIFLYEVTRPVEVAESTFGEGRLEWHTVDALGGLAIPETDRRVIWPLFWRYRGGFFAAHIDCAGGGVECRLEQPAADAGPWREDMGSLVPPDPGGAG
ncbi:MAG: NUDIX domain-containing protein [Planctomycetota bacterium]